MDAVVQELFPKPCQESGAVVADVRQRVTFADLARAHYGRDLRDGGSETDLGRGRCDVDGVEESFAAQHGKIEEIYCGRHLRVAVALTIAGGGNGKGDAKATLHHDSDPEVFGADVEQLLFKCCVLNRRASLTLGARDRRICLELLFGILSGLFRSLDRAAGAAGAVASSELQCEEIEYLYAEYERAYEYYERSAQRQAQVHYLLGMLGGLAAVVALAILQARGLASMNSLSDSREFFLVSLVAGSCGAIVSVMYAITSGTLRLNDVILSGDSAPNVLAAAGVMRPILGAVFGVALYVLVESGLLPIAEPTAEPRRMYFVIAIAFLAGFSERWARGILAGTEYRISANEDAAPAPEHRLALTHPPEPTRARLSR